MYHAIASLVATGAVITAGSNPQGSYLFQSDPAVGVFPAELRVEYYYPWCAAAACCLPPAPPEPRIKCCARAHGGGCARRRYFSVPRPLLQSVTGAGASFRAGSLIIVSAQLTSLANSAPPHLPLGTAVQPGTRCSMRVGGWAAGNNFHAHSQRQTTLRQCGLEGENDILIERRLNCAHVLVRAPSVAVFSGQNLLLATAT